MRANLPVGTAGTGAGIHESGASLRPTLPFARDVPAHEAVPWALVAVGKWTGLGYLAMPAFRRVSSLFRSDTCSPIDRLS